MPDFDLEMVVLGCIGGLLPDLLRLIKARDTGSVPKHFMFWLAWILLIAIGGFTAWLFDADQAKEAVALGFTAPEVLSKLGAKNEPAVQPADVQRSFSDSQSLPSSKKTTFHPRGWWSI